MQPRSAVILAALSLAACAHATKPASFQAHDPRLVGTWMVLENQGAGDSSLLPRGEKTYLPDGTACGYILSLEPGQQLEFFVFHSTWEIKDGQLISTVMETDAPFLTPGDPIIDDIVSVDDKTLRMHDAELPADTTYTRYRSPVDQGQRLCAMVHAVLQGHGEGTP